MAAIYGPKPPEANKFISAAWNFRLAPAPTLAFVGGQQQQRERVDILAQHWPGERPGLNVGMKHNIAVGQHIAILKPSAA